MSTLVPELIQSEYADIVQSLRSLTRQHQLEFRLQVGQLILQRFFGGQAALFGSHDPYKEATFADFLDVHGEDLAQLDQSEQTLRRCVRVRICYDLLPTGVREALGYSVLLLLSRVDEPNLRAKLAASAARERWTVARMRQALELARQHRVWDSDEDSPGLQLPSPAPEPAPQPGRLVTRTEKWGQEIRAWHADFARIDLGKLTEAQVARMRAAARVARAELDRLEEALGR